MILFPHLLPSYICKVPSKITTTQNSSGDCTQKKTYRCIFYPSRSSCILHTGPLSKCTGESIEHSVIFQQHSTPQSIHTVIHTWKLSSAKLYIQQLTALRVKFFHQGRVAEKERIREIISLFLHIHFTVSVRMSGQKAAYPQPKASRHDIINN